MKSNNLWEIYDDKIIPMPIASPCKSLFSDFKKKDSIAWPSVCPKFKAFLSLFSFLSIRTISFLILIEPLITLSLYSTLLLDSKINRWNSSISEINECLNISA